MERGEEGEGGRERQGEGGGRGKGREVVTCSLFSALHS